MFEILSGLSEDRTEASVQLPSMAGPQKMSADELSELIRHLTQLRADMSPAHENDPTPKFRPLALPTLNLRRPRFDAENIRHRSGQLLSRLERLQTPQSGSPATKTAFQAAGQLSAASDRL